MFDMILEQGFNYILSDKETFNDKSRFDQLQKGDRDEIVDYFMNIKDKIKLDEFFDDFCILRIKSFFKWSFPVW